MNIADRLTAIEKNISGGLNTEGLAKVLKLMGENSFPIQSIEEGKIYSDYLPKAAEKPFTHEQRYLHFLWDTLDRLPIGIVIDFAIPFRRIIARKLFKKCGENFICEEKVKFNLGQNIGIGDDVFFNYGVYLDAKGDITIGNGVALAEGVEIYTHSHSESIHSERTYAPVVIEDYAKIYTHSTILPGVTIGKQAIVAGRSMVTKDVDPNMVAAGVPAKIIRERRNEGRYGNDLQHIWFHEGAYQK